MDEDWEPEEEFDLSSLVGRTITKAEYPDYRYTRTKGFGEWEGMTLSDSNVALTLDDGTRVLLSACSCCDGIRINAVPGEEQEVDDYVRPLALGDRVEIRPSRNPELDCFAGQRGWVVRILEDGFWVRLDTSGLTIRVDGPDFRREEEG